MNLNLFMFLEFIHILFIFFLYYIFKENNIEKGCVYMKKSLIGTLALGLVIGVGALGVKAFANEKEVATQAFECI